MCVVSDIVESFLSCERHCKSAHARRSISCVQLASVSNSIFHLLQVTNGMSIVKSDDSDTIADWWTRAQMAFAKDVPEIADPELCEPRNMYSLWGWLTLAFADAYSRRPPSDDLIGRIYKYAKWCCAQPRGSTAEDDLLTCVVVCFAEHLPEMPVAMADMPRWADLTELQQFRDTTMHRLLAPEEVERWWGVWMEMNKKDRHDR